MSPRRQRTGAHFPLPSLMPGGNEEEYRQLRTVETLTLSHAATSFAFKRSSGLFGARRRLIVVTWSSSVEIGVPMVCPRRPDPSESEVGLANHAALAPFVQRLKLEFLHLSKRHGGFGRCTNASIPAIPELEV